MKHHTILTASIFALSSLSIALPTFAKSDVQQLLTSPLVITGSITDENNNPISDAKITLAHTSISTISNALGQYQLTLTKNLKHLELHVSSDNYSHISFEVDTDQANVVNKSNNLTADFVLTASVMEVIDIHATPLHSSSIESALPVNVLTSDELRLKQTSTLGDTLKNEVGIHATSYGGVASSPIIRGLDGARVLIAQNGLDVGDVSRAGADHAIAAESSTATQIEVLRGPATLFYGSGAIGGVVNVVDNRVPDGTYQNTGFEADYFLKHSSVDDKNEATISMNYGADSYALHADAFWRKANDYELAEAREETEEEHEEHGEDDDHEEHQDEITTVENSHSKASGYTIGGSYLFDNGYAGLSFGKLDKEYGIPFHSHDHAHDEHEEDHEGEEDEHEEEHHDESVIGKLSQQRVQFISEISPQSAYINKVFTKLAYSEYEHQELEEGFDPTTLDNNLFEARVDVFHPDILGWDGALTFHHKNNQFTAAGDEAYTPTAETDTWALALLEEKHFGNLLIQLGARAERVKISAELSSIDEDETSNPSLSFTPVSVSAGSVWEFEKGYNIGASFSYAQRAPSSSEVFSNGTHIGAGIYELGSYYTLEEEHHEEEEEHHDEDEHEEEEAYEVHGGETKSVVETSTSIDLTLRKFEGNFGFVISSFYSEVDNYYYQKNTGLTTDMLHHEEHEEEEHDEDHHDEEEHHEDGATIYQYQQADVKLYGFESEFHYQATPQLKVSLLGDYIRAKLTSGEDLPRIPPMRLTSELNYQADNYAAMVSVTRYAKQTDIAELETETDGYTMLNANFNYYLNGVGDDLVLFIKGDNLTNETAIVHSSFIKEQAPLPGRNISVGVRGSF